MNENIRETYRACLVAGACGDALGAAVEFDRWSDIVGRFGPGGIQDYKPCYGRVGAVTDDTQMALFTAEGLLRGYVRGWARGISQLSSTVGHAYQRWLVTQGTSSPHLHAAVGLDGWLITQASLHRRRGPGLTCLSALRTMERFAQPARNDSKGCGGIMRIAPVALFQHAGESPAPELTSDTFELACDIAALTHGHPSGQLSAGVFAVILEALLKGQALREAMDSARSVLQQYPDHLETLNAMDLADRLASDNTPAYPAMAELGEGWIAEEALAIALYSVLSTDSLESAVIRAVNHDGDSDSTGSLAGQLAGIVYGYQAIPARWLEPLELRQAIERTAEDLCEYPHWPVQDLSCTDVEGDWEAAIWERYPGY